MPQTNAPKPDRLSDIHQVRGYLEHRIQQLRSDGRVGEGLELGRSERDAILEFVRARHDVSDLRRRTYVAWLPLAAAKLGHGFLNPDRDTPRLFAETFVESHYKRASRVTVAQCLTTFWRWNFAREGKDYPSWLRIKLERWTPTNGASDMLTRDDVARIAEQALNFRDRAWIWALFNSGCRPGEIYRLRVGDVILHDEGYIELLVSREKGSAPEPAPVYEDAVPALLAWLNAHPLREDPAAPLWVELSGNLPRRPATYRAMYKALENAARRAKIAKPVTAYALRRSRLTMLAKDPAISTSILERIAGWVPGSKVAQHYVHLSGKDVIGALNARYGVKAKDVEGPASTPRNPVKCGRCRTMNPSGATYCMTCAGPLSLPAVKELETAKSAEHQLAELLQQPEAIDFLARLLASRERQPGRAAPQKGGSRQLEKSKGAAARMRTSTA
jgi:integrase